MPDYALLETLVSERQGRPVWFKRMTAIGPMATPNEGDRAVFSSEEAARQCPAMWHAFSFYEPRPVDPAAPSGRRDS